jgi:hypothetical protein
MNTPDLLTLHDRDPRAAYYALHWEPNRLHPSEILRRAVDEGVMSEEADPGQAAGDHVMTLAAERGLDIEGSGLYDTAVHMAALGDLITTILRTEKPAYARPEDRTVKSVTWRSGAFVEPSGVRLRRVVIVDRWNKDREMNETHSWRTLGEQSAYGLPMTLTIVLVGQRRENRHHSPWSKGWLHPRSRNLRLRKRSGEGFGGDWVQCWREEQENISRDKWIDQMHADGVMPDVLFDVDIPAPCPELASKIGKLAEKKLTELAGYTEPPEPRISGCFWPTPCAFRESCWTFTEPSLKTGFIPSE